MRVVHVVQTLVAGGAETMIRTLCPGLITAGIDAQVVSVYPSGLDAAAQRRLGVPVVELERRGRRDLGFFPRLVGTLRAMEPDVVHAHLHTGQEAGRAAALLAGVPAIALTVHGAEPGGALRWNVDRILHARTTRFIVFSEAQRRRFAAEQHVRPERIAVIPNGVLVPAPRASRAEQRKRLEIPPDAFALYAVGRLSPEKNQRAAIDAVAALRDAGLKSVYLAIAGSGPLDADLRAHARALGVSDRVLFLGRRDDAPELCVAMDLFLLTSLRERMPIALGEAMLAGLAPVVTPWEGYEDVVRDGGTGFVAGGFTGEDIAGAVLRAHRDDGRRVAIAAAARNAARAAFDVDAMVRAHVDLDTAMMRDTAR
ncbi:MAG: glycosyltransferase [Candidatus Elarobacter sp.]